VIAHGGFAGIASLKIAGARTCDAGAAGVVFSGGLGRSAVSSGAAILVVTAVGCSLADVAGDGTDGRSPDRVVDGGDLISLINSFSTCDRTVDLLAGVAGGGAGGTLPEGIIDGTDFIAFMNAFRTGVELGGGLRRWIFAASIVSHERSEIADTTRSAAAVVAYPIARACVVFGLSWGVINC